MTALGILCFVLVFLFIAGYFVPAGFDLGVSVLYPFLAKTKEERTLMRRAIGSVWDGNEVWLLTAGCVLFAAFAPAYATTFSGFYLAALLMLFGLILRAVTLEFAHHDSAWSNVWDSCFFIGSFLSAWLLGVAVSNIYAGIPMNANGDYLGIPLLGLITPFTLLCGMLGLVMFCAAGASRISLKSPIDFELHSRAVNLRTIMQGAAIIMFLAVSAYGHFGIRSEMIPELTFVRFLLATVVHVTFVVALLWRDNEACDLRVFIAQSVPVIALGFLLATSMFPNLMVATADSVGSAITIATAVSSETTLFCMTVIACIGVLLVLVYHVVVYRAYRGRLK